MKLPHEMLIANAGSGKTYRLTVRTITLLALGVSPEKIAALTFTRKAAGEFLEAVFTRLAKAALDENELRRLQTDTGINTLSTRQCRDILVNLTAHLHRLCMGTIDSLFGRIATAFPMESGLSENFAIMSGADAGEARRQVLAALFREQSSDENRFEAFLDLVRRQSRTQSERQVFQTLLATVGGLHEKFLESPPGHPWGDKSGIWPDDNPIFTAGDHREEAEFFLQTITSTHPDLDASALEKWQEGLSEVRSHSRERAWSSTLAKFIAEKLCKETLDKESGMNYVPMGNGKARRLVLTEKVLPARQKLLFALLKPRLEELLVRSRSLHTMLEAFESIYARMVRKTGRVTFGDITKAIAGRVDDLDWRIKVGYRLDAQFDHWLLDEFQDTSRPQWKVLGALVDEIIQDAGGTRSFFYVGDTKQAIYSWRGGDPKLFFEIRKNYNREAETPITQSTPLNVSFRSDPEIIEVVNQVFGNIESVQEDLALPARAVADWRQAWVKHEVTESNRDNAGYVSWSEVEKGADESDEDTANPQDLEILRILELTRPWERGWSCAALKRTNKGLANLAELLQSKQIPVAVEGASNPCLDNPLGVVLLATFRFAASPDDTLSGAMLAASPLGDSLLRDSDFSFREKSLRIISSEGFAGAVQSWLAVLDLSEEPFLQTRAMDFLAVAGEYDAQRSAGAGIGDFVAFVESWQRQEPESAAVVRLMTIHQAKGLTLDMAILSGMDAEPMAGDDTAGQLALGINRLGIPWGLMLPAKDISKQDDTLREVCEEWIAGSAYGELCAAYVAMTRPRHGLYLITKKLKESTKNKSFARLLALTLGQNESGWEKGNAEWYLGREILPKIAAAAASDGESVVLSRPLRVVPNPESASGGGDFLHPTDGAAGVGTEVHAALAEIEWMNANAAEIPRDISEAGRILLQRFFRSEKAREIFHQPSHPVLLWRERAFDLMIEGRWMTGIFDRVHIFLNESGQPVYAVIYDFKTTSGSQKNLDKRHEEQMNLYKKAVAALLNLSPEVIKVELVAL